MQALVQHYRESDDPVFRSDADTISNLLGRSRALQREWLAMQGPWYAKPCMWRWRQMPISAVKPGTATLAMLLAPEVSPGALSVRCCWRW